MAATPYLVFYDGLCRICRRGRQVIERLGPRAPVRFIDVNDPAQMAPYREMASVNVRGQMYVVDPEGRIGGGYDALVALAPILPAFGWLSGVLGAKSVRAIGRRAYRWLADNRYRLGGESSCHAGACGLHPPVGDAV
jgi:predicted DCC family thiol-disulfide oxidoreductase YuxK